MPRNVYAGCDTFGTLGVMPEEPPSAGPPWAAYRETIVTVAGEPAREVAAARGTFHVITAWNPMSRPTAEDENRRRQAALLAELAGFDTLPALGAAADGSHAEQSVAVFAITRAEAVAIGRRHHQAAVFEITPDEQLVISCLEP